MPPKKITWGDIPHCEFVKDKDIINGRWIECGLCDVKIKVRATFGFTEWEHHCASNKHCHKVKDHLGTEGMTKLTKYFDTSKVKNNNNTSLPNKSTSIKSPLSEKSKMSNPCPGFYYVKNPEFLHLYSKYKKKDTLNESILIQYRNGI